MDSQSINVYAVFAKSKGQQAMALAMIYPDPERGRGKKDESRKQTESGSFSYTRVKQARQVYRHSAKLAEAVLKGHNSANVYAAS